MGPGRGRLSGSNCFLVLGLFSTVAKVYFLHKGFIYYWIACPLLHNKGMGENIHGNYKFKEV